MYTHQTTIRLRDTDAAGVIYFPNFLDLVHSAFETYMDEAGLGVGHLLRSTSYMMPVVHAEAGYFKPLHAGDKVEVDMEVEKIGTTSFTLYYRVRVDDDVVVGEARITHVLVDREADAKTELSQDLRRALEGIGPTSASS